MNTMTRPRYNYMDQSCFSGPFCQNMGQISNNLNNSDCSGRFTTALMEFRNVMKCAATPGGVSFTDFPALILAQSKLIDVMSDIISSLLQSQQWQLDNGNKVRDMLTNLGNIFASCPTIRYTPEITADSKISELSQGNKIVYKWIKEAYDKACKMQQDGDIETITNGLMVKLLGEKLEALQGDGYDRKNSDWLKLLTVKNDLSKKSPNALLSAQ